MLGGALATVTLTGPLVTVVPSVSVATLWRLYVPFGTVVVFQAASQP